MYELIEDEKGSQIIKRTNKDKTITWIPLNESNADYQEYLNPNEAASKPVSPDA
jgi:hypothetical protein